MNRLRSSSLWAQLAGACALVPCLALATPPQDAAPAAATSAPATASSVTAPIAFASPHAAAVAVPSAAGAWGGPRTGDEPTLSDRVVSYTIQATLDPDKHTVDASQRMTWRNRSDRPVRAVYLHLYLNAFEGPGSTFFTEREVLTAHTGSRGRAKLKKGEWGHIALTRVEQGGQAVKWSFVHPDGGPDTDHTVVRLDLPQPVPAHGTLTLDMDFHDKLPRVVERTGWFGKFHLVAQWFPKIGVLELPGERGATAPRWNVHEFHFNSEFYADYGSYDVSLTVPKGYTVGAVGRQQGAPVEKDGALTYRFVQGDVHDFAWVAAPGYKTLDGSYDGPGSPHVQVRVIYPPEYEASAQPVLKATIDSLGYFSGTLGAYPYRTVTAVVPPYNAGEAGGMEYPTFFTAEGYDRVTPGTLSQYMIDFVTIHEFGHGYFYGILGSNEFEEPMLDEGLNEYWDDRMLRERGQGIDATGRMLRRFGFAPQVPAFVAERAMGVLNFDPPADPLGANAWDRVSSGSYGTVYARTASTMHDLEEILGKPALEKAFKAYYQRWKFRHPSIADLRAALAEASGKPDAVNAIFAQQVYVPHRVDDVVVSVDSTEQVPRTGTVQRDGKWVETTAEEVDKQIAEARKAWKKAHPKAEHGGPYPWRTVVTVRHEGAAMPTTLKVNFADGSSETVPWNDDRRWRRFTFTKPVKAVSAELDPGRKLYLDADKLNDSHAVEADGSAARRWTNDAANLLQSLYTLLGTL